MEISSYLYSLPYVLVFLILIFLMFLEFSAIKAESARRNYSIALLLVLFIFYGFRGFVNTDWVSYYSIFDAVPSFFDKPFRLPEVRDQGQAIEPGFIIYTILCKSLINNYFAWVLINTLIDFIVLAVFFRQYSDRYFVLPFIFFYLFSGTIIEINLFRNAKAIICFLISIRYLKDRKILPYMAINILGCFFHISSLLYLPLYFVLNRRWNRILVMIAIIIGNGLFLMRIEYIKPLIVLVAGLFGGRLAAIVSHYLKNDYYSAAYGLSVGYIERTVSFLLVYWFDRDQERSKDNRVFINLFYSYLFVYLYFSEISIAIERVTVLFACGYWIVYPKIYESFRKKTTRWLFVMALVVYGTMKLVSGNMSILCKYDNWLFGMEAYDKRMQTFQLAAPKIFR